MPKSRDRVNLYLTPGDREALNALMNAIQPGLIEEHGEESNAVMRMFRLGMAIYAGQPSMRHAMPPHPGTLIKLVMEARARDAAVGGRPAEEAQPIAPPPEKRKKA